MGVAVKLMLLRSVFERHHRFVGWSVNNCFAKVERIVAHCLSLSRIALIFSKSFDDPLYLIWYNFGYSVAFRCSRRMLRSNYPVYGIPCF